MNHFINELNTENNFIYMPKSYSRVKWTQEENDKLLRHVSKNGIKKWKQIATELKTKTAQQCRDHYNNVLDPSISNALWTEEEERILLLKYEQYGNHWTQIKNYLPGRTTNMIKNYLNILLKKGKKKIIKTDKDNTDLHNSKAIDTKAESKQFSFFNIESLLNHASNFDLNANSKK